MLKYKYWLQSHRTEESYLSNVFQPGCQQFSHWSLPGGICWHFSHITIIHSCDTVVVIKPKQFHTSDMQARHVLQNIISLDLNCSFALTFYQQPFNSHSYKKCNWVNDPLLSPDCYYSEKHQLQRHFNMNSNEYYYQSRNHSDFAWQGGKRASTERIRHCVGSNKNKRSCCSEPAQSARWVSWELMPSRCFLDEWAWRAVCICAHTQQIRMCGV